MGDSVRGAPRAGQQPYLGQERRGMPRFLFPRHMSCRARRMACAEWWACEGLDLSLNGMALALPQPVTAGQVVVVELVRPDRDVSVTRLLRVVHVFDQPGGTCRVGGKFIRDLSPAELDAMIF
jgi:hypothetical protein